MSASVAIIDYGSGNLKSAAKAFERAAKGLNTPPAIRVTADPDAVRAAERIILPGVGAFGDCSAGLLAVDGMREALEERVVKDGVPFMGICVGMQLMADTGREKGDHAGFSWIPGAVELIEPSDPALKIPHMGWNTLTFAMPHPIFDGITDGPNGLHAYFVHSYQLKASDPETVLATADYGTPITAAVGCDNMVGTQFHPEKSQKLGQILIENFLRWQP